MDYGEMFRKAAQIVWKHKILWLFGLLASFSGGASTNLNYIFSSRDSNLFDFGDVQLPDGILSGITDFIRSAPVVFLMLMLSLACGLALVFYLIGLFGRVGLTRGAWLADSGRQSLALGELAQQGLAYFWRMTGLTLLVGLPGVALALVSIVMVIFSVAASVSQEDPTLVIVLLCLGLPLMCLLVPFFWVLGILNELATVALVGEGHGVIDSLKRGWSLIRRHLGPVLLVTVVLSIAQIAFGLVSAVVAGMGIGIWAGGLALTGSSELSLGFIIPLFIIIGMVGLAVNTLLRSYTGTLWVVVFRRLAADKAPHAPAAPMPPLYTSPPPANDPFPL